MFVSTYRNRKDSRSYTQKSTQRNHQVIGRSFQHDRAAKKNSIVSKIKKVAVITGSTGQLGPLLSVGGLERDYRVVNCSRQPSRYENSQYTSYVQTPEKDLIRPAYWNDLLRNYTEVGDTLAFINTIGSGVERGESLREVNQKPVIAAAHGLMMANRNMRYMHSHLVHLSSIAPTILGDTQLYAQIKNDLDQELLRMNLPTSILRLGFVFNPLIEGHIINMGHAYSPEQIISLPVHPILGSGCQVIQPVYSGDIVEAVYNMAQRDRSALVNAVGSTMTQYEFFSFFATLVEKRFYPIHVPYDLAHYAAKHFPKGRLAPYAVAMFEHLERNRIVIDSQPFTSFLTAAPKTMEEVYRTDNNEKIILARPPLRDHAKEITLKLMTDREAQRDLWKLLYGRMF